MARKKTYIYRMLIGNNEEIEVNIYVYARNANTACDFCRRIYSDKKYNTYKAIKVGLSHIIRETQVVSEYETQKLNNSIASKGDKYSEREVKVPEFITKEEMSEHI